MPKFASIAAAATILARGKTDDSDDDLLEDLPDEKQDLIERLQECCQLAEWESKWKKDFIEDLDENKERPKVVFSFRSEVLLEVQAIAKELEKVSIPAHAINEYDNFRSHWTTAAKKSLIGVCVQHDEASYVASEECQKERVFLEGRAKRGKMLLFKVGEDLWEEAEPSDIALAIWATIKTIEKDLEDADSDTDDSEDDTTESSEDDTEDDSGEEAEVVKPVGSAAPGSIGASKLVCSVADGKKEGAKPAEHPTGGVPKPDGSSTDGGKVVAKPMDSVAKEEVQKAGGAAAGGGNRQAQRDGSSTGAKDAAKPECSSTDSSSAGGA